MNRLVSKIINKSLETETGPYSAARISAAVTGGGFDVRETFSRKGCRLSAIDCGSRFYIYSVTKSFIAALILKLAGSKALSLEDKVDKWFPAVKNSGLVSVYNCLRHTGGFQDYGGDAKYNAAVKAGSEPWSFDEFIDRTLGDKLLFTPGEKFSYSNIGYMLLKKILEIEYGASFSDLINSQICLPLSLGSTGVSQTKESLADNIFGPSVYLGSKESPADIYKLYHPLWVSHGVISSSAYETAVIMNAVFSGALLERDQLDIMTCGFKVEGVTGRPFYDPHYGCGLMTDTGAPYGPVYGHTGGGPGSSAACYHLARKSKPFTVAVLTDGEDSVQAERIVYEIFEAVNG